MRATAELWTAFARPIRTAEDYIGSLRGRRMNIFFMGEHVSEPVDHPVIRPSINAMAETYRLASEQPELATAHSDIVGSAVNRFLHIPTTRAVWPAHIRQNQWPRAHTSMMRCSRTSPSIMSPAFLMRSRDSHRTSPVG